MIEGLIIGVFSGWLSLASLLFLLGRKVVKNPPEALVRAISKAMGRSMANAVTKAKHVS